MKPIPIFHIKSNNEIIKSSEVDQSSLSYSGNGLLISKGGLLATVSHVLESDVNTSNYALVKDDFYKIEILNHNPKTGNENYIDAALCKIKKVNCVFYDPSNFGYIQNNSNLQIVGFSRKLIPDMNNVLFVSTSKFGLALYQVKAMCLSLKYKSFSDSFTFSFSPLNRDPHGLSGSPIINEDNKVVGLFKGGPEIIGLNSNRFSLGRAIYIGIINEMFLNYNNKS